MSRQISIFDLLNKLEDYIPHAETGTTKPALMKIFMLNKAHPQINSEQTFNEKLRLLVSLGFLDAVSARTFKINWPEIDMAVKELRPEL